MLPSKMPSFSWRADTILFHILYYMIIILHCSNRHFHLIISSATYLVFQPHRSLILHFTSIGSNKQTETQRSSWRHPRWCSSASQSSTSRGRSWRSRWAENRCVLTNNNSACSESDPCVCSSAAAAGGGPAERGTADRPGATAQTHRSTAGVAREGQAKKGPALGQQTEGLYICCVHSIIYR